MKVFIDAPTSGRTAEVEEQIKTVTAKLEEEGHVVVSLALIPVGFDDDSYPEIAFTLLRHCDAIYVCDELRWERTDAFVDYLLTYNPDGVVL
jgi:hypothetical protein